MSCAEGDVGYVYDGLLPVEVTEVDAGQAGRTTGQDHAESWATRSARSTPASCPITASAWRGWSSSSTTRSACIRAPRWTIRMCRPRSAAAIEEKSCGLCRSGDFYVEKLAEGVATLAAAFWPKPVIVRLSDFKSNEYANLLGGRAYEPVEENPMLGLRGASRYVSPLFRCRIRARMPGGETGARGDGANQCRADDPVRAHRGRGRRRGRMRWRTTA